jgi:hypothetical protein
MSSIQFVTKSDFAEKFLPYFAEVRKAATKQRLNSAQIMWAVADYLIPPRFFNPIFTLLNWEIRTIPQEVLWAQKLLAEQEGVTTSLRIRQALVPGADGYFLTVLLTAHWGPGKALSSNYDIARVECFDDYDRHVAPKHYTSIPDYKLDK